MSATPLMQFKRAIKTGAAPASGLIVHKLLAGTFEAVNETRQVRFTVSTNAVDRDNDTVSQTGWDLTAFKANPVVLWSHQSSIFPVGKCVAIDVEGDALKAVVEFVPADIPIAGERAEAVLRMCREGFLSATSVGFRPLAYEIASDRMDDDDWWPALNFTRQELMEFSLCSIPANPEALIDPSERIGLAAGIPAQGGALIPQAFPVETQTAAVSDQANRIANTRQHRLALLRAYG
jgi:HK97 family phage prohead protease